MQRFAIDRSYHDRRPLETEITQSPPSAVWAKLAALAEGAQSTVRDFGAEAIRRPVQSAYYR
jgi:hypothetical protein